MDTKETSDVPKNTSLLLAEYSALRDEILRRMDIEHQLATFTIILFGTVLGIGLQNYKMASLILLYPTLALFLSIGWSHSDYTAVLIGRYIRDHIEAVVGSANIGWEHFLAANRHSRYYWAMRGIFISTQLLALVIGVVVAPLNATYTVVLCVLPL